MLAPYSYSIAWRRPAAPVFPIRVLFTLLMLLPAAAHSDIYKWTDEQGGTVYANSPPEHPVKAGKVERVIKERVVPPAERALQDRIDELERRLRSQAYAPPPPPAPIETYYPPPPPPGYIGDSGPVIYSGYRYPLAPAYSYFYFRPRTTLLRPAMHGTQRGPLRGGFAHRGRR